MMHSETSFGNENEGTQIGTFVNQESMAFSILNPSVIASVTDSGQKAVRETTNSTNVCMLSTCQVIS